eukprot:TRINITY_DN821_c0_g5_i1.p1 TRINITY_DN821_c0_g5~~TRINITY_DN821_c0_g5_i1.p1  ORF type:complete len:317 (+),score=125.67 TRINITY_DN821_c0_g5_i1:112-1062(+)
MDSVDGVIDLASYFENEVGSYIGANLISKTESFVDVASGNYICRINLIMGEMEFSFKAHESLITCLTKSTKNVFASVGWDELCIWDENFCLLTQHKLEKGYLNALWSLSGDKLLLFCNTTVQLFNVTDSSRPTQVASELRFDLPDLIFAGCFWNSHGQIIVICSPDPDGLQSIAIYNTSGNEIKSTPMPGNAEVIRCAKTPNTAGHVAILRKDNAIYVFNEENLALLWKLDLKSPSISTVVFIWTALNSLLITTHNTTSTIKFELFKQVECKSSRTITNTFGCVSVFAVVDNELALVVLTEEGRFFMFDFAKPDIA